jgi:hypothetical protein
MPGREQTCLDMTCGHDGPYLGAHVANSAGRSSTMLPNPRTAPRELVDHAVHQDGMECHDRLTTPACSTSGEQGHDVEPHPSSYASVDGS